MPGPSFSPNYRDHAMGALSLALATPLSTSSFYVSPENQIKIAFDFYLDGIFDSAISTDTQRSVSGKLCKQSETLPSSVAGKQMDRSNRSVRSFLHLARSPNALF